ncbi:hypothetical protein HCEG_09093 [Histoplasma capsulatum var. duboisii H88]|uniref:Uncharacterized protein n=2 Tax=Ajellomyces capsulatus TaxID=5037 RepID=F0UVF1_AJEC8|nr:hypothetical protein HCDG_01896 [Histoplasma capsulatum H143]EGC49878.1 hypothetical protein HCEG_09093 [Histoplasma capsulatum var. duboisii H88]QSS50916.1 hypothetical protein I7I53_06104 [Histoplasma capsulatum var. duboisii H88]
MAATSARTTSTGSTLLTFSSQKNLAGFDTVLIILSYLGSVGGYVCWREGMPAKAAFRASMGFLITAWSGLWMAGGR